MYTFSAWLIQLLTHPVRWILFKYFLTLKVKDRKNIQTTLVLKRKTKRGVLFVVNHTSELDQLIIPIAVGPLSMLAPMHYVARAPLDSTYERERWGWRAFTYAPWFLKICGGFPVASGKKDYAHALAEHVQMLKTGKSVVIFPEGSVTRESFRGKARGGVGFLIEEAKPIVVPILIEGLFQMNGGKEFWNKTRQVSVTVHAPLVGEQLLESAPVQNEKDVYYRHIGERVLDEIFNPSPIYEDS